ARRSQLGEGPCLGCKVGGLPPGNVLTNCSYRSWRKPHDHNERQKDEGSEQPVVTNDIDVVTPFPIGHTFLGSRSGAQRGVVGNIDLKRVDVRPLDLAVASVPPCQFNRRQGVVAWPFQNIGGLVNSRRRQSSGSPVNIILNRWLVRIER